MRRRLIAILVLFGGAAAVACNVLRTVDRCKVDADCAAGFSCDPEGRYCFDRRATLPKGDPDAEVPSARDANASFDAPTDADADASDRGPVDAGPPPCDLSAPFGDLRLVRGLEASLANSARFSADEKTVIFSAFQKGCEVEGCADLYFAERAELASPFGAFHPLPGMSVANASEYWPTMTSTEDVLFFESGRVVDGKPGSELARIWTALRTSTAPGSQFGPPQVQDLFRNISGSEGAPYLHPNGKSLYFISTGRSVGGYLDIFVATLGLYGSAQSIKPVAAINTPAGEHAPVVTLDDLTLYFAREEGLLRHVMRSTRATPADDFGPAEPVEELATGKPNVEEFPSWVSPDHCRLYFVSNRPRPEDAPDAGPGSYSLWIAERPKPHQD